MSFDIEGKLYFKVATVKYTHEAQAIWLEQSEDTIFVNHHPFLVAIEMAQQT